MKDTQMSLFNTSNTNKVNRHKKTRKRAATKSKMNRTKPKHRIKHNRRPKSLQHKKVHNMNKHTTKSRTNKKAVSKPQQSHDGTKPIIQTEADKAYVRLKNAGLTIKCQIFKGGLTCQSIALSCINSNQLNVLLGEDANRLCKLSNETSPYCYYHYSHGQFILMNGWLMNQIYKYRDDIK